MLSILDQTLTQVTRPYWINKGHSMAIPLGFTLTEGNTFAVDE